MKKVFRVVIEMNEGELPYDEEMVYHAIEHDEGSWIFPGRIQVEEINVA